MGLILRWFYDDGERHRAFIRTREEVCGDSRELVISGSGWEGAVRVAPEVALEDYSDERLTTLARVLRRGTDWRVQAVAGD